MPAKSQIIKIIEREEKLLPVGSDTSDAPRNAVVLTVEKQMFMLNEHPVTGELIRVLGKPLVSKVGLFSSNEKSTSGKQNRIDDFCDAKPGMYVEGSILSLSVAPFFGFDGDVHSVIKAAFLVDSNDTEELQRQVEKTINTHNDIMLSQGRNA